MNTRIINTSRNITTVMLAAVLLVGSLFLLSADHPANGHAEPVPHTSSPDDDPNPYIFPSQADSRGLVESGCVIRFDTLNQNGDLDPRILANSGHHCVGVRRVAVNAATGYLRIFTDTEIPVVDIQLTPDETMVRLAGAQCGPSGGVGYVDVHCYDRDGNRIHFRDLTLHHKYSNLWFHQTGRYVP